jgi:hypothetical protein
MGRTISHAATSSGQVQINNPTKETNMNSASAANPLLRVTAPPYPVLFVSAVVLVVLVLALADSTFTQPTPHAAVPESRLARCERLAGVAVENLAERGIDVQTPRLRQQREVAVQACAKDFANFDWLLNGK